MSNLTRSRLLRAGLMLGVVIIATIASANDYQEAREAMREQRWDVAIDGFLAVEQDNGRDADAAVYWQAWIYHEMGQDDRAQRQIDKLQRRWPDSPWIDDARALSVELGIVDSGSLDVDDLMDDEMRLYALMQLSHRDPDRALPIIEQLIERTSDTDVQRNALFLLANTRHPDAETAIVRIARDESDARLAREALQALVVGGSERAPDLVIELYDTTASHESRAQLIDTTIPGNLRQVLEHVLAVEDDTVLRRKAFSAAGAMGDHDWLRSQFDNAKSDDERGYVIDGLMIAGDGEGLRSILDRSDEIKVKAKTIRALAMTGEGDVLRELAEQSLARRDNAITVAILDALVILGDGGDLAMSIAEQSDDPAHRRKAIQVLAISGDTERLGDMYRTTEDREIRESLIDSFVVASSADLFTQALNLEKDEELRARIIRAMGISGELDRQWALDHYADSGQVERNAVRDAFFMSGDSQALIELARAESDPQRRRELVRSIVMIGGNDDALFELLENGQ